MCCAAAFVLKLPGLRVQKSQNLSTDSWKRPQTLSKIREIQQVAVSRSPLFQNLLVLCSRVFHVLENNEANMPLALYVCMYVCMYV